jgi:hypothetical protein
MQLLEMQRLVAGEKVLAEGQLAYLEDSDVVQYLTAGGGTPPGLFDEKRFGIDRLGLHRDAGGNLPITCCLISAPQQLTHQQTTTTSTQTTWQVETVPPLRLSVQVVVAVVSTPQNAAATQLFATNSAPGYYLINYIQQQRYDGFKLSVASGTMTGSYTIYASGLVMQTITA